MENDWQVANLFALPSYKTNMQENAAAKVGLYHELARDCECKVACTISLADSNNPPCRTVQFIFKVVTIDADSSLIAILSKPVNKDRTHEPAACEITLSKDCQNRQVRF